MINKELVLNRISELCNERNWTYNQLTIEAELSPGMIYQWYSKKHNRKPSFEAIDKICNAFQITLSEFFAESHKDKLAVKENIMLEILRKFSDKEFDVFINLAKIFLENKEKIMIKSN